MTDLNAPKITIGPQSPSHLAKVGHWTGDLYLRFASSPLPEEVEQTTPTRQASQATRAMKTVVAERQHQGPYTVQRPFYPEGGVCHSILLHPPGGLVEGDVLSLKVDCEPGSHAFMTTPSAGKVYECSSSFAAQQQLFHIHDCAILEWFPQEMILYDRSKSDLKTDIRLYGNGQFIGWEMVCFGRPIAGDHFSEGELHQFVSLYRDDKPILLERTLFDASSDMRQDAYGFAGYQAMGVFLMTGSNKSHLERAREVIDELDDDVRDHIQIGFTLLDDVLVGRVLMHQTRFAKTALTAVWSELREDLINVPAMMPRIWLT